MTIEGKIIGFDRQSDMAAVELDLPGNLLGHIKVIAKVPASDPDIIGSYQLDDEQIRQIAETTHLVFDTQRFQYFLEGYEATNPEAEDEPPVLHVSEHQR